MKSLFKKSCFLTLVFAVVWGTYPCEILGSPKYGYEKAIDDSTDGKEMDSLDRKSGADDICTNSGIEIENPENDDYDSVDINAVNDVHNNGIRINSIEIGEMSQNSAAIDVNGNLWTWGSNVDGILGNGNTEASDNPIKIMENVKQVSLQINNSAAVDIYGNLWMWGSNFFGLLNPATNEEYSYTPIRIKTNISYVKLGVYHHAIIDSNETLWVKTDNSYVDLREYPIRDAYGWVKVMENVQYVDVAESHIAILDKNNKLWMMGWNDYGQLGDGTTNNSNTPVLVMQNVKQVSIADYYNAAVDLDGNLWVWGTSWMNNSVADLKPVKKRSNVKKVSAAPLNLAIVDENDDLYMCGYDVYNTIPKDNNYESNVENNALYTGRSIGYSTEPKCYSDFKKIMSNIKDIVTGFYHVGVIDKNGWIWTWGKNEAGQLGDGTRNGRSTPKSIEIPETSPSPQTMYTVTFNSMGGSDVVSQKVVAGEYASKPVDPIKDGLKFSGWFKDQNCTKEWNFAVDKVSSDIVLYAKWINSKYKIIYDGNGATSGAAPVDNSLYTSDDNIKIMDQGTLKKTGYLFVGWTREPDGTSAIIKSGSTLINISNDIVLYAKWEANSLDIKKDIWSFHNYSSEKTNVTTEVEKRILDYADGALDGMYDPNYESKRQEIKDDIEHNNGHCHGFSGTVISNLMGYRNIATNLFSATFEQGNPIISEFQLYQFLPNFAYSQKRFMSIYDPDRITEIMSVASNLSKTGPALLSYGGTNGWGGHTVVIYGMEQGSFKSPRTGKIYNSRLNIYDCNAFNEYANKYDDPDHLYDIYVNTKTNEWELPAYYEDPTKDIWEENNKTGKKTLIRHGIGDFASWNGSVYFKCVTTVRNEICSLYKHNANSMSRDALTSSKTNDINTIGVNSKTPLRIENGKWNAIISQNDIVSSSEPLISYYNNGFIKGQPSTSPLKAYLPDGLNDSFSISPDATEKGEIDMSLLMGDFYFSIHADEAKSVSIEPDGSFEVIGNNGELNVKLASDLISEDRYNVFEISGNNSGNISLSLNDVEGTKVTGDSLAGMKVTVSDGDNSKEINVKPGQQELNIDEKEPEPTVPDQNIDDGIQSGDLPAGTEIPDGIWIGGLKKSYPYTGNAIKPEVRVYYQSKRLTEGIDYTLSYNNNKAVGTSAAITVKCMGDFKGSKTVNFTIEKNPLTDVTYEENDLSVAKDGKKHNNIKPVLMMNGEKLKYSKNDFEYKYYNLLGEESDCSEVGEYTVRMTAKATSKGYSGYTEVPFSVTDKIAMGKVTVTASKKSLPYNGEKQIPAFTLKYNKQPLVAGTYTMEELTGDNYTAPGSHTVIFKGNGTDVIGSRRFTYKITGKKTLGDKLTVASIASSSLDKEGKVPYANGGAKPKVTVSYDGIRLKEGRDYTLSYKGNTSVGGSATVTAKGKGKYAGSVPVTFTVSKRDLDSMLLTVADRAESTKAEDYKKTMILFTDDNYMDQKLSANKDYTAEFTVSSGTDKPVAGDTVSVLIKAKEGSNYTGQANASFNIIEKAKDISQAKVKVNGGKAYEYTGKAIEPARDALDIKLGGKPVSTSDYEVVAYYNNINRSNNAVVIVKGKNNLSGAKAVKFKIGVSPLERFWKGLIG